MLSDDSDSTFGYNPLLLLSVEPMLAQPVTAGLRGPVGEDNMARDVASTRIPGNESELPIPVPPVPRSAANPPAARPPVGKRSLIRPLSLVPHRLTAAERYQRICDLAYRRAEQRGFAPGGEIDDWLEAEREVDAGRY
jgi:hypothetical protein